MPAKIPPFLQAAGDITAKDRAWFDETVTGWNTVHAKITSFTERQLLVIVRLESEGKQRPEIVGRCLRKFNALRAERELKEFWAVFPGVGHRAGSGRKLA